MVVNGVSQMIYDPIAFCVINQGWFFSKPGLHTGGNNGDVMSHEQQAKTSREQSQRFSEEMRIEWITVGEIQ